MKYIHLNALFLVFVFHTSCGQNQTNSSQDNIKSVTKDIVTSPGPNERNIHTKHEYTDSIGKRLIIQNSFPRGGPYTDPTGKRYTRSSMKFLSGQLRSINGSIYKDQTKTK